MDEGDEGGRKDRGAMVRWVLIALIAAGVLVTGWRGPWRGLVGHGARWDWGLGDSMSRAWGFGGDPSGSTGVLYAWVDGGGPPDAWPLMGRTHVLLYPPTTLAVLAPL